MLRTIISYPVCDTDDETAVTFYQPGRILWNLNEFLQGGFSPAIDKRCNYKPTLKIHV